MSDGTGASDGMESLWAPCAEAPEDEKRHETFITYAIESGQQMEAIERYNTLEARAEQANNEELGSLAKSYKAKIAQRVALKLLASASTDREAELASQRQRQTKQLLLAGGLSLLPALIPVPLIRGLALVFGVSLIFGALFVYGKRNAS